MKYLIKYFILTAIIFLVNKNGFSQLPSERPMSAIAPKLLKDGPPKATVNKDKPLASERKMPAVNAPKGSTVPKTKTKVQADPKKLPSNSKTRIKDLVKKPKVKN